MLASPPWPRVLEAKLTASQCMRGQIPPVEECKTASACGDERIALRLLRRRASWEKAGKTAHAYISADLLACMMEVHLPSGGWTLWCPVDAFSWAEGASHQWPCSRAILHSAQHQRPDCRTVGGPVDAALPHSGSCKPGSRRRELKRWDLMDDANWASGLLLIGEN